MDQLRIVEHPIGKVALTTIRRRDTPQRLFREEVERATLLIAAEVLRPLATARVRIHTPLEPAEGAALDDDVLLVPILRAGLVMVDSFLRLVPDARVGHIGLYREEATHDPVDYYLRLPRDIVGSFAVVLDPMLATGGSAVRAINLVKQHGANRVVLACLIAAPEGVRRVQEAHPDVAVFAGALDRGLDDQAFIRPGLGDAGDRLFGTEQ